MDRALKRSGRRIAGSLLLVAGIVGWMLAGSVPAGANNDPHRMFSPTTPYDIPANVCGFLIHVTIPVENQYASSTPGPEGSTILHITGSFVQTFTTDAGTSITLNSSGPGTVVLPPTPGTVVTIDGSGLNTIYITNGAQFGVPNFMYSSGLLQFSTDTSNDTIVSMTRTPHVLLDICAALS